MSSPTFSLSDVLDDLSLNIYNLKDNYDVSDISNQILNLNANIDNMNSKLEQILNLYAVINELKVRLNS
jgi:hypothetical protein